MTCSKLTEPIIEALCEALRAGATIQEACRYAEIGYATYKRWWAKAKERIDDDDDLEDDDDEIWDDADDDETDDADFDWADDPSDLSAGDCGSDHPDCGPESEEPSDSESMESEEFDPLVDFYWRITRARLIGERDALLRIQEAGETDWRAAAWYLERTQPADWGALDRETAEELQEKTSGPRRKVIYIYERPSMGEDQYGRTIELSRDQSRPPGSRIEAKPPFDDISHEPVVWGPVPNASSKPAVEPDEPGFSDVDDDPWEPSTDDRGSDFDLGSPSTSVVDDRGSISTTPETATIAEEPNGQFLVPPPSEHRRPEPGSPSADRSVVVSRDLLRIGTSAIVTFILSMGGIIGGVAAIAQNGTKWLGELVGALRRVATRMASAFCRFVRDLSTIRGVGETDAWMTVGAFQGVPGFVADRPLVGGARLAWAVVEPSRSWPRRE